MAIVFDEGDKDITFTNVTGGATIRNIRFCATLSTPTNLSEAFYLVGASELTGFVLNAGAGLAFDEGKFALIVYFSGDNGIWRTTNDVLVIGYNEIFITLDGGSTSNDPVFYHNGVSVSVTENVAPTGTIDTSATVSAVIGQLSTLSPNGTIWAVQYYTGRVITAAEVADAYNSRIAVPNFNGLVFSPNLNGAAGLQTFDGATLGSTNYMRDIISGATGTPNGSPVGAADTYLNWK